MKLKKFEQKDRYGNMFSIEFDTSVPEMSDIPNHPGGPKGTDTVPAWLTPGEFVMNAEAVRMFEPQIEAMNNKGRTMQAAQGGTIPEYSADGGPIYAAAGGGSSFLADILRRLEGVAKDAYLDTAGKPTLGVGSTRNVQMGDTADDEQINKMLAEDLSVVDEDYSKLVTAKLNPNQEAAVKSLLFNIGGPQFANSKARAALNAGDMEAFKKEAAEFRKVGDEIVPGLVNRRTQELALFDSPVGEDPWGISKRHVATVPPAQTARDDRAAKLIAAGQPTDLAMEAAILGQDAETAGEIVTPPPIDRGVPSAISMIPGEEQDAFQRDVEAAQKATREQGMYDPDGNMEAIQAGIDQAQILEDQRRRQQVIPSRIQAVPSEGYGDGDFGQDNISSDAGSIPEDTRGALQKFGESGGLMGAIARGTDSLNDTIARGTDSLNEIKEKFQEENTEQNRVNRVLLEQDRMQQGQVPELKEPPKVSTSFDKNDLPPGFVLNTETGKVERASSNLAPATPILKDNLQARLTQLESAKQRRQSIIDNGGGPGDPIFDQEQAYIEKLEKETAGVKEKVDAITDKTTKVFVDGELEVTNAEIEKKTNQAKGLVDLGLSDAAKKVEQEVKDLNAKKERLEAQSKDLVKDDQTEALDPAIPTVTTPAKPSAAQVAAEVKKVDDGSAAGTKPGEAEAAVKKAGSDGTDKVNKAESWLADTFGGLFDAQELKRMAILYAGSRLMGNSHAGSLNWAAEGYLDRVGAHEANVQKLAASGDWTPTSVQNFKKTKDYSTLMKAGTSISPTGTKQTWYTPEGRRVQAEKYKTGKDSYVWSADGGRTAIPSAWHQDASRVKNTDEYNDRIIKESGYLEGRLAEVSKDMNEIVTGSVKGGDRKTTYVTGLRPKSAASQVARWAAANGIDVASAEGYAINAFKMAVADANADPDKKTKPTDLRPYLNQLKIRQDTGIGELFDITLEDGTIAKMDSQKIEEVSRNYLARRGMSGSLSEGDLVKDDATGFTTRANRNAVNNFWTEISSRWAKKVAADPSIVDEWAGKALPGETPFFAWAKANT